MITLDNKKIKYVPEFSFLKKHLDLNITPSRKAIPIFNKTLQGLEKYSKHENIKEH